MGHQARSVPIRDEAERLAELIRDRRAKVDRGLRDEGEKVVAVYLDPNFGLGFQDLRDHRRRAILDAIDDLAGGGALLQERSIVTALVGGKLRTDAVPYADAWRGSVVHRISIKDAAAFRGWAREATRGLVDEEKCWPAIYRLILELASAE